MAPTRRQAEFDELTDRLTNLSLVELDRQFEKEGPAIWDDGGATRRLPPRVQTARQVNAAVESERVQFGEGGVAMGKTPAKPEKKKPKKSGGYPLGSSLMLPGCLFRPSPDPWSVSAGAAW